MSDDVDETCITGSCRVCGNVIAIIADAPDTQDDIAKFVSGIIRDGLRIGTVSAEAFRTSTGKFGHVEGCVHKKARKARKG